MMFKSEEFEGPRTSNLQCYSWGVAICQICVWCSPYVNFAKKGLLLVSPWIASVEYLMITFGVSCMNGPLPSFAQKQHFTGMISKHGGNFIMKQCAVAITVPQGLQVLISPGL